MISCGRRLRKNPCLPEAQKAHFAGHPTWEETHTVRRCPDKINTDSTMLPSCSFHKNLNVSLSLDSVMRTNSREDKRKLSASLTRRGLAKLDIWSHEETPLVYTHSNICFAW